MNCILFTWMSLAIMKCLIWLTNDSLSVFETWIMPTNRSLISPTPIFPLSIQGKLFPSSLITTFISKQTEGYSISQRQQQMSFNALVRLLYLKISRLQFGKLFYVTNNIINTKMGNKSQKIWEVLWQCSLLMDHEICTPKKVFWEHSC